jgi:hypothetical protein
VTSRRCALTSDHSEWIDANPLVVKGTDAYRMPQFRLQYSDQEIADVVTFIRNG